MKPKLYTLFAVLIVIAASCKTAKKMYEKGNYDEAVALAAKKLQKDPDDPKLLPILREAYQYADADHQSKIRGYSESTSELKWEWMYNEYVSLQKMHDAIFRVPAIYEIVHPADYTSYLATYAEKAADVRYDRGMTQMEKGDKQSYRNAYNEFSIALQLQPGQRDIETIREQAYEFAVTNVVVLPMQQQAGFVYSGYAIGGQNFDDMMLRELQTSNNNIFTRFYSAWEARSNQVRTDAVLDMRLTLLDIGRYRDQRTTDKREKQVVLKETVYRPDSIVREYGFVYAKVTKTNRSIRSEALMQIDIRDADGRWLWSDQFHADHDWSGEFGSYSGDERALTDADKELVKRGTSATPDEREITRCLMEQIRSDAFYRVKNYFRQF